MHKLEQTRSEEQGGYFTKIRQSGLEADLRAYAYSVEDREVQDPLTHEIKTVKRAYLWYLDMVGRSREALKAIWAGLVNHPPKPAVLYREVAHSDLASQSEQSQHQPEPEPEEETPSQMWVYLAERERAHGFRWKYSSLPKAAARQGVLVPEIALARPPTFIKNTKTKAVVQTEVAPRQSQAEKQDEATAVLELIQTQEFLLLALNEFGGTPAPLNLAQLYYRRLDGLSQVPLLPQWDEWLWYYAQQQGLVEHLTSFGCEAYLCRQPQEQELAQAISLALQHKQLLLPNHQLVELVKAAGNALENNLNLNHHRKEAA
jgi:hypothetical protein